MVIPIFLLLLLPLGTSISKGMGLPTDSLERPSQDVDSGLVPDPWGL